MSAEPLSDDEIAITSEEPLAWSDPQTTARLLATIRAIQAKPREKSAAEKRAEELRESLPRGVSVREAITQASVMYEDEKHDEAAAWLLVAQRMLAREAAR